MNKKILFASIFIVLGLIALQIPINQLAGSRVKFTLFDLFAPISGAFVGVILGVITVFSTLVINLILRGFSDIDKGSIIRLIPTLFAVWYFALRQSSGQAKRILLIPALSIIVFNLHPIGRTVWYYSLFWLIPILVWPARERFLLARSLGATFTAHSVGGAIWIWAFNLPANVWITLIPVVALERSIFALGISASYILFNNLFGLLARNRLLPKGLLVDRRYLFPTLRTKV